MSDKERLEVVERKLRECLGRIQEVRAQQPGTLEERHELLDVLVGDLNHHVSFLLDWLESA